MLRVFLIASAILAICPLVASQTTRSSGSPLSLSDAKRLVAEALGGDPKKSAAAEQRLGETRPEDRQRILDAVRSHPWTAPRGFLIPKSRVIEDTWDLPNTETKKGKFFIHVPKDYDGKKPFPVLFRFHGSGATAAAFVEASRTPASEKFIMVTPEVPTADRAAFNAPGCFEFIDRLIVDVRTRFNTDPNRLYLSGHSGGGAAAFCLAQIWPHRVAGFYAMASLHFSFPGDREACMETLRTIPGFFVVGKNDVPPCVDGFRFTQAYYEKAKLPGEFMFVDGRGHEQIVELHPKAYDYLLKSVRRSAPTDINGVFYAYDDAPDQIPYLRRRYWLEVENFADDHAAFHAKIDGQKITIDSPNFKKGAVLLNDDLVNMDLPVEIVLNGKVVAHGAVERSPAVLISQFRKERDRGELFWNRVAIEDR